LTHEICATREPDARQNDRRKVDDARTMRE
jgi:hypothetical protein